MQPERAAAPAGATPDARGPRCPHCATPVDEPDDAFCCAGCEAAYAIVRGAGLERYYAVRTEAAPRPEGFTGAWAAVPVETASDGTCRIRLAVDGLRCASCVWVTENLLQRTDGVVEAGVSYGSGRATLRWDPERVGLPELAGAIAALGYRPRVLGEEASPDRDLLLRLGVAAFGAANVMLFSAALYAGWFGGMAPRFEALFRWVSLAVATPVALWSAAPFFAGAWAGLRVRVLHMDVPIALAVAVLYAQGLVGTLAGAETYLDSMTMLVALLLAGRVLETRGRQRAADAALTLAATVPATARRERGGTVEAVPSTVLAPGDRVLVGPGGELPADGVVVDGAGQIRAALLTGEAMPVPVTPGDRVWAGTVLVDGTVTVEVTEAAGDTLVSRMADELREAADRDARPSSTDRIAPWFTAATLVVAAGTLAGWWAVAGAGAALGATVAVLVVACPCALALSRPLAAAAGLGAAARRGLLLRTADAFLALGDVDAVALDKTGTVTAGDMDVVSASDADLRIAAGLERFSTHPVARAILREAVARGIPLPRPGSVREEAGAGVAGVVDGMAWRLRSGGAGVVVLEGPDGYRGLIRLDDAVRPDSAEAVEALRATGVTVWLLTGDHAEVATRIAGAAGIERVEAGMDPEAKAAWIHGRQAAGGRVLFAGDGLNDGPALAVADVGVAMGGGVASSILAADGVLSGNSVRPLAAGILASRVASKVIRANQVRSIAYNVLAVSAAAAGLVNPLVAAVLMPLSSAMVLWGASRVEPRVRRAGATT
ncbi:MAG: heavy metal translocating P-type ATPase metal-binding domain-containing protein [Longimicrobiales bacterium]